MKTAQQIIGLPVVSIFDGNEIGKVKNVIINASKGTIDFFVIDSGIRSLAGGVIPADRVLGIGEYALTIQQPDDISDIVNIPAAIELMQKNITVRGTRVLTKKGSLLGETGDIYINDEESYNITGVEFIPSSNSIPSGIIPRSSIITFGKNLLVVQDDFINRLVEMSSIEDTLIGEKKNIDLDIHHNSEPEPVSDKIIGNVVDFNEEKDELFKIDEYASEKNPDSDFLIADENHSQETGVAEVSGIDKVSPSQPNIESEASLSAADLFEQRQRQYLVGKRVTKPIYDTSGGVIANSGEIITEQLIQTAKEKGRLIELVMNYEE
jgi:uncharacterized protein YrrD